MQGESLDPQGQKVIVATQIPPFTSTSLTNTPLAARRPKRSLQYRPTATNPPTSPFPPLLVHTPDIPLPNLLPHPLHASPLSPLHGPQNSRKRLLQHPPRPISRPLRHHLSSTVLPQDSHGDARPNQYPRRRAFRLRQCYAAVPTPRAGRAGAANEERGKLGSRARESRSGYS